MDHKTPAGEFDLIAWIRDRERNRSSSTGFTRLGIGDDCAAVIPAAGVELLVTTDMLMDGRHFRLNEDGGEAVGYKALGVNISDIAAMAGIPRAAVVAVALPKSGGVEVARGLHAGMSQLAERFRIDLIGGDTNAWDGPLVISVTLFGEATDRGAVRRSGARPGDAILVTGPLGGSILGRHLRPEPRVDEALALHVAAPLHALIDISDGLSSDLGHILEESGNLGATLDASAIPIHDDARLLSQRDGRTPLEHALNDGEDFELCVVVAPRDADRLIADFAHSMHLVRVGEITKEPGLRLRDLDGRVSSLNPGGFDHFRAGPSAPGTAT
ncbi:MAG: thiamine-monophosphate kinase [Planctomycetes bacterium SCN 63-9]|nr:MAG: thiamine-monophosphate kinase [Planctomycetes bacterium SCN 63-9]